MQEENREDAEARFLIFLERESTFSLDSANPTVGILQTKKQSGSTRRGNAWTPVLGVFDNFHEVGYFPTWFTFSLKAL